MIGEEATGTGSALLMTQPPLPQHRMTLIANACALPQPKKVLMGQSDPLI
jgi:hypothetical protein